MIAAVVMKKNDISFLNSYWYVPITCNTCLSVLCGTCNTCLSVLCGTCNTCLSGLWILFTGHC